MGIDELTSLLWRRKAIFGIALALSLAAVVLTTLAVPKTYEGTATIFVGQSIEGDLATQTLDSTQGEQLARTFTTLAANPQVAEEAAAQLDDDISATELLDRMSISPVERTQLLEISAEADSPEEAAFVANAYASAFVARMSELHSQGRVPTTVALSANAVPPTDPARPNVPLYLGFGAILSLLLAFAAALAVDRMDRSVRIGKEEESLLGQPILTRVPRSPEAIALPVHRRLARQPLTDSLRVLRTNLELAPGSDAKAILVTSPEAEEGKTTVARELALAIAADGDSVALVELDLRRPALDLSDAVPGLGRDELGASEVLAGRCRPEEAIQESPELPHLGVLYSGTLSANTARLLRSSQAAALFADLRRQYDWVIVDAPPLLVADDVLLLTPYLDGTLLVIDVRTTTLPAIRSAIARLTKLDSRILGLVLNNTEAERGGYYYQQSQGFRQARLEASAAAQRDRRRRADVRS